MIARDAARSLAFFALLVTTGCGDDSQQPSAVDGFDPRLRGIYSLESHTKNGAACEPSADNLPDQDPLFAIDTINFRGRYLLGALTCGDAANCRSHIERAQAPGSNDFIPELDVKFFFLFLSSRSDGSASAQVEGASIDPADPAGASCTGEIYSDQLTHADGTVRIESRIVVVPPFPVDPDGECRIPDESRAAPCNAFELVTGVLLQAL